jgi:DNA-binding response OmpR family regulator
MARVLICEPHADISALLELVVRRLGHDSVSYSGEELDHETIDAAVIEPGAEAGLRLAKALRARNVPVLFTSIYPPERNLLELAPAAYLVKPFPLYALERALGGVLATLDPGGHAIDRSLSVDG